jgi:hypothetical protein
VPPIYLEEWMGVLGIVPTCQSEGYLMCAPLWSLPG